MLSAIELLESFERKHPGSQFIDDALYYLGKAHQGNKEQLLARQAFRRVVEDFPRSPFAEDARFEIARSWFLSVRGAQLDAEPAEEALRSFRVYLRRFPQGRHVAEAREGEQAVLGVLAEKDYLNGRTYMRLGRHGAARRYFEKSLTTWADSPHAAKALDGVARTYESEGNRAGARQAYERLLEVLGGEPARFEDGIALARRAREKLAGELADGS
jgi:outer membrane assembly lipoprotein YfiO